MSCGAQRSMALFDGTPLWSDTDLSEIPKAHLKVSEADLIASYRLPAAADCCQEEPLQRPEIDRVFVRASGHNNRGARRVVRVDGKRKQFLVLVAAGPEGIAMRERVAELHECFCVRLAQSSHTCEELLDDCTLDILAPGPVLGEKLKAGTDSQRGKQGRGDGAADVRFGPIEFLQIAPEPSQKRRGPRPPPIRPTKSAPQVQLGIV
jgi:hypothetical protein